MKGKDKQKIIRKKPEFDPSLEEIAKLSTFSGRLVEFVVITIIALILIIANNVGLMQNITKINSLEMGVIINLCIIGLIITIMLIMMEEIYTSKGDALCRLKSQMGYEKANKYFDKALKIDRGAKKAWTGKGLTLRMMSPNNSGLKEALGNHNRALKIDPKYTVAWVNKGNVLINLGKTDEALICYDRALDLDPNYTNGWVNKGALLKRLGMEKEGEQCLMRARYLADEDKKYLKETSPSLSSPVTYYAGLLVLFIGLFISLGSLVHNTIKVFVNETSWSVYGPWDWSALIIGALASVIGIIFIMRSNITIINRNTYEAIEI